LDDHRGIANSLGNLGVVATKQGEFETAREHYEESLELHQKLDSRRGIAGSLNDLGLVARNQGDFETAREYFEESLELNESWVTALVSQPTLPTSGWWHVNSATSKPPVSTSIVVSRNISKSGLPDAVYER
jgi:tetratricopeptide (TPR) repeat protein